MTEAHADRVRNTGLHLAELLRTRYRHRWYRADLVDRDRGHDVHVSAVARVLADHLHDHPREGRRGDREIEPRALTPTVSRALAGRGLSPVVLERFVGAFAMRDDHAAQLRAMLAGTPDPEVVVGGLAPPSGMPGFRDKEFDTLMLHEHHWLGVEGLPVAHRSQINIRSRVDGLSTYQYRIDTPHAEIESDQGGEVGELVPFAAGLWAVDLRFAPLAARDTHYIEFRTRLHYEAAPPPVMRRGTHELIENLDIRVQFHERRLPSAVRFGEWATTCRRRTGSCGRRSSRCVTDRRCTATSRCWGLAVVGFEWDW